MTDDERDKELRGLVEILNKPPTINHAKLNELFPDMDKYFTDSFFFLGLGDPPTNSFPDFDSAGWTW